VVLIECCKTIQGMPFGSMERVRKRHLSFRHELTEPIMRIHSCASFQFGKFLREKGFLEIRPPILSTLTDPGTRGAGCATIDFYGKPYRVTTSMILHKQMAMTALEKVFSFSPNIRLEPVEAALTGRHLAEFTQLDLESAFTSRAEITALAEEMISVAIAAVKKECGSELEALGRKLKVPKTPFRRISYSEALLMAEEGGLKADVLKELDWESEKLLSEKLGGFFWIYDYPPKSRGFYDRRGEGDFLVDFDLMYPGGFGEAISGSEREFVPEKVKERMLETGLEPAHFDWYFEMLEAGVPPSAGFGLGIERFIRYVCGLEAVWQAASFPKVPGVHSP
jgi:asparaginyl-tRNA synthetase